MISTIVASGLGGLIVGFVIGCAVAVEKIRLLARNLDIALDTVVEGSKLAAYVELVAATQLEDGVTKESLIKLHRDFKASVDKCFEKERGNAS